MHNYLWFTLIVIVFLSIAPIQADRITLEACRLGPLPLWINITGCSTAECVVQHKDFITMEGQLVAPEAATQLQLEVAAFIWGFRLSYSIPLDRYNACNLITTGCPLQKDGVYYVKTGGHAHFPIRGSQRLIEVLIRNEKGHVISCGKSKIKFK